MNWATLQINEDQREHLNTIIEKTGYCLVIAAILAVPKVLTQQCSIVRAAPKTWFSIASVVRHDNALNRPHDVELSGNLAFVPGKGGSIAVIDISSTGNPRVVASVPFADGRGPNGLTIAGKAAFIAGGQSIDAIDISEPCHPIKLGSQRFPRIIDSERTDNAHDLVYRDGYLYVSCQTDNAFMILKVEDKYIRDLAKLSSEKIQALWSNPRDGSSKIVGEL